MHYQAIGAATIDLEWVQVHPTGLVKPDDPDAKVKFLAAEALRGVGGIVLDANGNRFCNELGRRDSQMQKTDLRCPCNHVASCSYRIEGFTSFTSVQLIQFNVCNRMFCRFLPKKRQWRSE